MFRTPSLVAGVAAALLGLLLAGVREADRVRSAGSGPGSAGVAPIERCLTCHAAERDDPGGAHASPGLGCSSCHLGNPKAFDKERAHKGLEREPGALSTVARTCGREGCHPRETSRLSSSLMTRGSGIVAVDRWIFGEVPEPDSAETLADVLTTKRPTAGQHHLRKLCAGCHLGARRANRDDAITNSASGCSACHVVPRAAREKMIRHPAIDARVGDDRCLGCHSKSGRVSLSYAGLEEVSTSQARDNGGSCAEPVTLHDGRPGCRRPPDVHRAAGMSCVDCHLHTDLMGDGTMWSHQEDQVEVTCESCHQRKTTVRATWADVRDPVVADRLRARGEERPSTEPVRVGRRGTPLWNLRPSDDGWILSSKLGGRTWRVAPTPEDPNHRMRGHERLSCSACHAASAPTCSSCHTGLEREGTQWDFAAARPTRGAWIEQSDGFGFASPALGVTLEGTIVPAIPGMILTASRGDGTGSIGRRVFAPIEPHTTGPRARSCESCHRSPVALGLGTGRLSIGMGTAAFLPTFPSASDGSLASDGWTKLFAPVPASGTRVGFRSLNASEQRSVLAVGECLPCHSRAADPIWSDFRRSRARVLTSSRCRYPRIIQPGVSVVRPH
jgi:hypothetical protein